MLRLDNLLAFASSPKSSAAVNNNSQRHARPGSGISSTCGSGSGGLFNRAALALRFLLGGEHF